MGTSRGKNQETNLQNQAQAATDAIKPTAYEDYANKRNLSLLTQLDSGKDVKDIAELSPNLNLFNSSVANNQDYAGEGLLSPNALSGGNTGQLGLISKQISDRRRQQAEGDLYNGVMDARQAAEAGGQWGAVQENSRNMGKAGIVNQRYTAYLNRPQKPGILSSIIGGGASVAGSLITKF